MLRFSVLSAGGTQHQKNVVGRRINCLLTSVSNDGFEQLAND